MKPITTELPKPHYISYVLYLNRLHSKSVCP